MHCRLLLVLSLLGLGPGLADAGKLAAEPRPTHRATVELETLNGHRYKFKYDVTATEAVRIESVASARQVLIARAKRDYTRKHIGYREEVHGPDVWKMVPGLKVRGVRISERRERN